MKRRWNIPLRMKFMLTFLILVTLVVGLIAFSTATLFREDKLTYVNGLSSMVSVGTADETRSTLDGYRERLELYARILLQNPSTEQEQLSHLLFDEFPDLIAIQFRRGDEEPVGVYNTAVLESSGLTPPAVTEALARIDRPESATTETTRVYNVPLSLELPTFAMTLHIPVEGGDPVAMAALLNSRQLVRIVSRFSAYEQFLVDSAGNYLAHSDPSRIARVWPAELLDEAVSLRSQFNSGVTLEYDKNGNETIGSYAGVDLGDVLAVAEIPKSAANLASRRAITRILLVASGLLVFSVVASVIWAHRITRPMERLSEATERIARGDFTVDVSIDSGDEIGELASSFNRMAGELTERDRALLEAQHQLVQSEKMAAFGQLGAGIAHEVKNPLAGILACAQLAADEVPKESAVFEDLRMIEKESKRCKLIIENLLKFARQEKSVMLSTDVTGVIQDSVAVVNHQLALNEVQVEQDLDPEVPEVRGNANQLQQVFVNLLINAQQAMEGPGKIRIVSRLEDDGVVRLRFIDTGPGIPLAIQAKIFEPFFTTKPTGKGTGLGLSVSFGIIKDHRGEIEIESEPGKGTTFVISLPVFDPATDAIDAEPDALAAITAGAAQTKGEPARHV